MAAVPSQMLELGTPMPAFSLPEAGTGKLVSSDSLRDAPASVVAFICNHCPYVKHIRGGLAEFGRFCAERGVKMVAINSNDVANYPDDAPEKMAEEARAAGYSFPYLFDETQDSAKAYRAACTPEFYIFDSEGSLRYRGQFDDSRPGNGKPVTGAEVRAAIEALLSGQRPSQDQTPSIGCNIKWKRGNAPEYA
jgi:thiol-disulfide isomerase/thioredoxin